SSAGGATRRRASVLPWGDQGVAAAWAAAATAISPIAASRRRPAGRFSPAIPGSYTRTAPSAGVCKNAAGPSPPMNETIVSSVEPELPPALPVLVLRSAVLFPSGVIGLQVATDRSLRLVESLPAGNTLVAIFGAKSGESE